MNGKKKTFSVILGISTVLVLALIVLGIYLFYNTSTLDFFKTERNGIALQAFLYDQNGNRMVGTAQTAVDGVPGLFYMSFAITTTNTGNVELTDVRIQESHTAEFTQALQGEPALHPTLMEGETNVLQWDTANTCSSDTQCGASEKCVNDMCLIDISNFLGDMTFGATIEADYLDAQGALTEISTLVNIAFLFEQDEVVFRTTSLNSDYGAGGTQVAVDRAGDGTLEAYTYTSSGQESYVPSNFISRTVQNNIVYRCGTSQNICVSQSTTLDDSIPHTSLSRWKYVSGGTIPTTTTPVEPYLSENCGGISPCQERYSVAVAPQPQECGNDLIEGTELCDGIDLGGDDCVSINQGFEGGTLACDMVTNPCQSWDITLCEEGEEPPTGNAIFRTTTLTYSSGGIAYATSCGNNLVAYGRETGMSHTAYECNTNVNFLSGSECSSSADCLIMEGLPNGGAMGSGSTLSTTDFKLYQDDSDATEIWVCVDDVDGDGSWTARFDDGSSTSVSTSPASETPSLEKSCL